MKSIKHISKFIFVMSLSLAGLYSYNPSNAKAASHFTYIYKKDFKNWPFKEESYTLGCLTRGGRPLVYMAGDEITYALNGAARGFGRKNLKLPWSDGNDTLKKGMLPIDSLPFIQMGLKFCK